MSGSGHGVRFRADTGGRGRRERGRVRRGGAAPAALAAAAAGAAPAWHGACNGRERHRAGGEPGRKGDVERSYGLVTVLAVFGLVATLPSPGVALERTRGATGAEVVFLRTPAEAALLPGIVAGEGIPGAVGARLHVAGLGRVVWREIRDEVDPQGARHRFYRQHLLPEGALGASLGGEAAAQGIELVGGELGLHYDRDGNLEMVFGTQFGNVEVLAAPRPPARGRLPAARGRRSEPGLLQLSGLAGCDVNVTALGLDKARRIFFHTLTHYCTSSTGWEDLPDLMILAAYHLYKQCPIGRPGDPALEEQRAVDEAFTAIGYLGSGYHECPY